MVIGPGALRITSQFRIPWNVDSHPIPFYVWIIGVLRPSVRDGMVLRTSGFAGFASSRPRGILVGKPSLSNSQRDRGENRGTSDKRFEETVGIRHSE